MLITLFGDDTPHEVGGAGDAAGRNTIEGGIDGFFDLGFPIPSDVFGGVDCAGAGDHFGAVGSRGEDSAGFAGDFGREGDAFPLQQPAGSVWRREGLGRMVLLLLRGRR